MQPVAPSYDPSGNIPRPYVRFELRPVESRTTGQSVFTDRAWVILMAPGSRDTTEMLVDDWLPKLREHARNKRVPVSWPMEYEQAFNQWMQTQEQPAIGTSVRNWPACTPAQLQSCLKANLLTVEDVANANEEALNRVGMGARSLQIMAKAWIADQKGGSQVAAQIANLTLVMEEQKRQIEELRQANAELQRLAPATT
jgi:hypothetical protein